MNTATRGALFVDKISLTMQPASQSAAIHALDELRGLAQQQYIQQITSHENLLQRYESAFKTDAAQGNLSIQASPRHTSGQANQEWASGNFRFFRLEWNPSKLEESAHGARSAFRAIRDLAFLGDLDRLHSAINITRIDFTTDVLGQHISGLRIYRRPLGRSESEIYSSRFSHRGRLQSISIGKYGADRRFEAYDKRAEQHSRRNAEERLAEHRRVTTGALRRRVRPLTRLEMQMRDLGAAARVQDWRNPLRNIEVLYVAAGERQLSPAEQFFLDSCAFRGAQAAVSLETDTAKRQRLERLLQSFGSPTWWRPDEIWEERHAALASALAVFD